jgi:hypothetical protein
MEIGKRTAGAAYAAPPARPADMAAKVSAPVEMPEDKVVTAAAPAADSPAPGARLPGDAGSPAQRERAARPPERIERVYRDEAADEWVFSKVDAETGAVLNQFPDDAKLRQRAYTETIRRAELDAIDGLRRVTKIV